MGGKMAMRMSFNRMLLALAAGWLVISVVPVSAQSSLPPCQTGRGVRSDPCFMRYTYRTGDGSTYAGEWKDGFWHGWGSLSFPRTRTRYSYVGEWRMGKYHGRGTETDETGSTYYVGEFRDGSRYGQGSLFSSDGRLLQNGIWRDGELVEANNLPTPAVATQGSPTRPPR